jgi:hypothetical protein
LPLRSSRSSLSIRIPKRPSHRNTFSSYMSCYSRHSARYSLSTVLLYNRCTPSSRSCCSLACCNWSDTISPCMYNTVYHPHSSRLPLRSSRSSLSIRIPKRPSRRSTFLRCKSCYSRHSARYMCLTGHASNPYNPSIRSCCSLACCSRSGMISPCMYNTPYRRYIFRWLRLSNLYRPSNRSL